MISQALQIKHLLALQRELVQHARFTTAGHTANNPKRKLGRSHIQISNHLPPKSLIAAIKLNCFPTNALQNMREGAATFASTPAVDQWTPLVWHIHKMCVKVTGNVLCH